MTEIASYIFSTLLVVAVTFIFTLLPVISRSVKRLARNAILIKEKKAFFKKMKPYFDAGLMREVCRTEDACIISLGELFYLACPYFVRTNDGTPFGVYFSNNGLINIVSYETYFLEVLRLILDDVHNKKNRIYLFSQDKVAFWKTWIEEKKETFTSVVDTSFEQELLHASINRYRKK